MGLKAVLFSTGLEGALSSFTSCCALCSCGGDGHPAVYASVSAAQSAFPKLVCIPPACPKGGVLGFLSIHTHSSCYFQVLFHVKRLVILS